MSMMKNRYGGLEPTKRRKFKMSNISRLADPVLGNDRDAALSPAAKEQRKLSKKRMMDSQSFEKVCTLKTCAPVEY